MQTKMIDRTDEKIALAKEIGMKNWADNMVRIREEVAILTDLRFKPITYKALEKMLCKGRVFRAWNNEEGKIAASVLGCAGSIVSFIAAGILKVHPLEGLLSGLCVTAILSTVIFLCCSFPKLVLDFRALRDWTDNIPYGALLAVKEAKASGIDGFMVYYPRIERQRVLADPAITGRLPGSDQELLIFAWDDSRVYE